MAAVAGFPIGDRPFLSIANEMADRNQLVGSVYYYPQ
jgi:hypothetical protein